MTGQGRASWRPGWLLAEALPAATVLAAALAVACGLHTAVGRLVRAGPVQGHAGLEAIRHRIARARTVLHPRAIDGVRLGQAIVLLGPTDEVVAIRPGPRGIEEVEVLPAGRTEARRSSASRCLVPGATGLVAAGIGRGPTIVRFLVTWGDRALLTSALSLEAPTCTERGDRRGTVVAANPQATDDTAADESEMGD